MNRPPPLEPHTRRFLTASQVMDLLGYSSASSFWATVKSEAIPHTRINQRRIIFDEQALNDWLAMRSTGAKS